MFSCELKGIKEMVRDLKKARKSAIPHAVRSALNTAAFDGRHIWQREIRQEFTTRNQFTERSVLVERAKGTNLKGMQAVLGSAAPYMGDQETGSKVRGRGRHKAIPFAPAAGLPDGSKRTKLVRSRFRLSAIAIAKNPGRSSKQRNAIAISMAVRKRQKAAILLERPGGGKGLFTVSGGRRRTSIRRSRGGHVLKVRTGKMRLRLLWDMGHSSVRVPRAPTLQRTLKLLQPKLQHIFAAAVVEQLRRHRICGY